MYTKEVDCKFISSFLSDRMNLLICFLTATNGLFLEDNKKEAEALSINSFLMSTFAYSQTTIPLKLYKTDNFEDRKFKIRHFLRFLKSKDIISNISCLLSFVLSFIKFVAPDMCSSISYLLLNEIRLQLFTLANEKGLVFVNYSERNLEESRCKSRVNDKVFGMNKAEDERLCFTEKKTLRRRFIKTGFTDSRFERDNKLFFSTAIKFKKPKITENEASENIENIQVIKEVVNRRRSEKKDRRILVRERELCKPLTSNEKVNFDRSTARKSVRSNNVNNERYFLLLQKYKTKKREKVEDATEVESIKEMVRLFGIKSFD